MALVNPENYSTYFEDMQPLLTLIQSVANKLRSNWMYHPIGVVPYHSWNIDVSGFVLRINTTLLVIPGWLTYQDMWRHEKNPLNADWTKFMPSRDLDYLYNVIKIFDEQRSLWGVDEITAKTGMFKLFERFHDLLIDLYNIEKLFFESVSLINSN